MHSETPRDLASKLVWMIKSQGVCWACYFTTCVLCACGRLQIDHVVSQILLPVLSEDVMAIVNQCLCSPCTCCSPCIHSFQISWAGFLIYQPRLWCVKNAPKGTYNAENWQAVVLRVITQFCIYLCVPIRGRACITAQKQRLAINNVAKQGPNPLRVYDSP